MRAGRRAIGGYVFRISLAGLGVLAWTAWTGTGRGQVNLPPPPPPPLSTNNPPPPPPPANQGGGGGAKPRQRPVEQHTAPPPQRREEPHETYEPEESPARKLSIRLNPLPLFLARLSVDIEYQLAPHHALVGSPNFTFKSDRATLPSRAFGYTIPDSSGAGAELGYHYWLAPKMEGLYLGPSLLLGFTGHPVIKSYAYYGVAFDVGYQLMLPNGFTFGGGGGLLLIGAGGGNALHLAPRFLAGIGWSF
jgi:hypothetical protein